MLATRILERDIRVLARLWHSWVFSAFVMPVLFLAAMGVGLGGVIDEHQRSVAGLSYLHFVAPGLLVAAVMQQAAGESLWPVLGGVKWDKRYFAMIDNLHPDTGEQLTPRQKDNRRVGFDFTFSAPVSS